MPKISGEGSDGIQGVVLTLRTLEALARARGPIGVTELAEKLGTTKTRAHRHLRTLVQEGYASQHDETGRYRAGGRLISLGRLMTEASNLVDLAQNDLRQLRDTLGQSCVLSQFEHSGARIVMALSGRSPIEIGVKPGSLLLFHNSAQGRVMLAHADSEFRETILARPMSAPTAETITTVEGVNAELEKIRKQGWATAANQTAIGLNTLAAPLFDATGGIVGAVGIVDLVQFLPPQPDQTKIDAVMRAARQISRKLGYEGDREETDASDASPPPAL
ncbi:IclR family transcriptional regulator [Martelella mediterranea]|uniref:IclR family transcriptional regulator n=1 Tax=Martelella mediterranea TaxID=293089 RepID=UPI001E3062C4|nr:IclR family transcriptional regulator [Martelella mediterranea]MCD1633353.1 IclR family transcriptional regulator [Martelella mediterranea]